MMIEFTALPIVFQIGFFIALPISILGFIKTFRAKTVKENVVANAMFAVPILSLFLFAFLTGLMDLPTFDAESFKEPPDPIKSVENLNPLQIFFIACAFGIGIIGNAILWRSHWKRTKKKWTALMNPLAPPFAEFNSREWMIFWSLLAAFFIFGFAGIAIGYSTT